MHPVGQHVSLLIAGTGIVGGLSGLLRITLMFNDDSGDARLVVPQDQAADSVARGVRGSALLDELGF